MSLTLRRLRREEWEFQASYQLHRGSVFQRVKGILSVEGNMTPGKNLDLKKIRKSSNGNGRCVVNIEEWGWCFLSVLTGL